MTLPSRSCDVFEHSREYNSSNKELYIAKLCKNGKVVLNETVINPPAELGRLTDARCGERSNR